MKNDETKPKYVRYVQIKPNPNMLDMFKIYCKKIKQHKQSEFQKLTQNQPVYNELSLNLEPKVIDVQLS
jgi:hypothetical protein